MKMTYHHVQIEGGCQGGALGCSTCSSSIDRPSLWRYTAITQPFLNQFAKSWAHWKEDIEIYQWRKSAIVRKILIRCRWAAQFAPILIFLSALDRSQCKCLLSNEPKILQIG
eukprot:sb/3477017/